MHLYIKLEDGSRPFQFQSIQTSYIDGNYLCVRCHDDVVNRFALEDVREVREEQGEPLLDASMARLRVKIWLKNTSGNAFFFAESTDDYGPFYRVKSGGSVVCFHRRTISFIQEEPLVKAVCQSLPGCEPLQDFFEEALAQLDTYEIYPPVLPDKCGIGHLKTLSREALDNAERYPLDKLCRWMGFVAGVLSTLDRRSDYSKYLGLVKGDLTTAEQNVLSVLFDRYLAVISRIPVESARRDELKELEIMIYDSLEVIQDCEFDSQSIRMGYVQGVLAAKGLISVDEERDFTRPVLHSLHGHPVPSFPGAKTRYVFWRRHQPVGLVRSAPPEIR